MKVWFGLLSCLRKQGTELKDVSFGKNNQSQKISVVCISWPFCFISHFKGMSQIISGQGWNFCEKLQCHGKDKLVARSVQFECHVSKKSFEMLETSGQRWIETWEGEYEMLPPLALLLSPSSSSGLHVTCGTLLPAASQHPGLRQVLITPKFTERETHRHTITDT